MISLTHCPGTLSAGHDRYCPKALKEVFGGRSVSHLLDLSLPNQTMLVEKGVAMIAQRISVSGMQEKLAVIQRKNKLYLPEPGEQSTHIVKPIPRAGKKSELMPANEHLSMQLAKQIFRIETAPCALMFLPDGSPVYITRRFDVKPDGSKWAVEDFASLMQRTPATHGDHYKYQGSYLDLFHVLSRVCPAYTTEAVKLFKLLIFNYLINNGDAHIKNFSMIETAQGDFKLSPAYDLLNTRLHIDDSDFALSDGLIPRQLAQGNVRSQFLALAEHAHIARDTALRLLGEFTRQTDAVAALVQRSFLPERAKRSYLQTFLTRQHQLTKESPRNPR